jgi:hypothetical protein
MLLKMSIEKNPKMVSTQTEDAQLTASVLLAER